MNEIKILDDDVINKIAAGEVVERPASIVKELMENSLDASADKIEIVVEGGGKRKIIIQDTGKGIGRDDLKAALLRHATSKISSESDLDAISTLGFRGEALAAISSVARLRIESRRRGTAEGFGVESAGGKTGDIFPVGLQEGTRITAEELFFNTPARMKFLKSDATELSHIIALAESYSLAQPAVSFSLKADSNTILELSPAADVKERFFDLFPELPKKDFSDVEFESPLLSMKGFLAVPSRNLSATKYIFTIVNGRLVKDRLLQSAILRSYEDTMPRGRFPVVFLELKLSPRSVDVNVHPAKREIRFRQSGAVFETVVRELTAILHPQAPGLTEERLGVYEAPINHTAQVREPSGLFGREPSSENGASLFQPSFRPGPSNYKVLAIWRDGFIILDSPSGLSIVDQHVLHERIRFEQFRKFIEAPGPRKAFLEPRAYFVPRALSPRIDELSRILTDQGIEAEAAGEESLAVRSVPAFLDEREIDPLVEEFISEGKEILRTPKELLKSVLTMRSCRGSIMLNDVISIEKAQYLIDLLFAMNAPLTCPHGRPIMFTLKKEDIFAGFHRK